MKKTLLFITCLMLGLHTSRAQQAGNALAFERNVENFRFESLALALRTIDPRIFHEVHVDFHLAEAAAVVARAFFDIETEVARVKAAEFRSGEFCKKIADFVEELDVGGRIGAGRSANRRLVDGNHFVDVGKALHRPVFSD